MIHIGFMLKADRQFTDLTKIYSIPRRQLLWQDVEKKYGSPDESNVEGYWLDDEPEIKEKEKPTGKERQKQDDSRDDSQQRWQDRMDRERMDQDPTDWHDKDYGNYWGNQ